MSGTWPTWFESLLFFANTGLHEQLRSIDLADAVSQATRNLAPLVDASSAKITVGELPVVWTSPIDLVRLLQNLIGNALKYRAERQPEIHISAERLGADGSLGLPTKE